jgi:hypothetical protein
VRDGAGRWFGVLGVFNVCDGWLGTDCGVLKA